MLEKAILFFVVLFLFSCSSENGQISNQEVRPLSGEEVNQFIQVLPVVLDFSDRYNNYLSEDEKKDPDYNQHYFAALKKSQTIRNSVEKTSLKSVKNFMEIYKNVFLAYYSLKTEITNITEMSNRRAGLDAHSKTIKQELQKLNGKPTKQLKEQMENLHSFNVIYSNLLIVKKYESMIDRIVENRNGD